jgi:nucleotide-binding universal stress UspA family protein
MSVFTRPLVALSLSAPDAELLRYAALALLPGRPEEVRFAHVAGAREGGLPPVEERALRERMEAEVRASFGGEGVRTPCDVVQGSRLDSLLSLAVAHGHDVIVLGHRRGRQGRRSLARRLAMVAPCSIWLAPEGSRCALEEILVPVDFSSCSADALSLAAAIAAERGLRRCRAVHVSFDPSTVRYDEHVAEILGKEEAAFADLVAGVDRRGVAIETLVEESAQPARAILRVAERTRADLIVMNTRGRSRAAAVLLGSVTSEVMAATTAPLLAVKHFGAHMSVLQALLSHRKWEERTPKTN